MHVYTCIYISYVYMVNIYIYVCVHVRFLAQYYQDKCSEEYTDRIKSKIVKAASRGGFIKATISPESTCWHHS